MLKRIILVYLLICKLALGYINIYPTFFYERLEDNKIFKTIILTNTTEKTIRYRLYTEEDEYKNIKVEIYPKSVTLKPLEKKEVKILMTAQEQIVGEFSKKLVVKEIELPKEKKKILTMFKLKLSGFGGDIEPKLEIKELGENRFSIKNVGKRVGIYDIYNLEEEFIDAIILKKDEVKELKIDSETLIFEEKFKGKEMVKRGISNET